MPQRISRATVLLEAKNRLKNALQQAKAEINGLKNPLNNIGQLAKSTLGTLGIGLGAAIAVRGIKNLFTETIKTRDEIAKFSKATGISVEFLSEMSHATQIAGADMTAFQNGMRRMQRVARDAQAGLSTAKRSFETLGISVEDSGGNLKDARTLVAEIADAFKVLENDTLKVAVSQEIFGRGATQLIPLLNMGADGIAKLQQEARDLGIAFGEEAAVRAEEAADAMVRFDSATTGLSQSIVDLTLPALTKFTDVLTQITVAAQSDEFQKLIALGQEIGRGFAQSNPILLAYLKWLEDVEKAQTLGQEGWEEITDNILKANEATKKTGESTRELTAAEKEYNKIRESILETQRKAELKERVMLDLLLEKNRLERANQREQLGSNTLIQTEAELREINIQKELEYTDEFTKRIDKQMDLNKALRDEFDVRLDVQDMTAEQILMEDDLFRGSLEVGRGLAIAAASGGDLADELERAAQALLARGLLGGLGALIGFGIGGAPGAVAGFNAGFGLQHGGSFMVGGPGTAPGPDRNVVAFHASQGERVIVQTPQQQQANGGPQTIVLRAEPGATMTPRQFQSVMRSYGYRVILEDTALGKGL